MRRISASCTALLLLLTTVPLFAKKAPSISESELAEITLRGRALYEYDQAAWHSSDAVQALHPIQGEVGRYIARKTDTGWNVAFGHLSEAHDGFLIAYMAIEGAKPQEYSVQHYESPQRDTGFYLAAAKAIDLALASFHGEQRSYNVAVLPAAEGKLYVYVLPAQTKTGVYPLGGDARYLISADGGSIIETRQMHHSILDFDMTSPEAAKTVAGYHIHVLSKVPEDSDVFFVLTRRPSLPEFIGVEGKMVFTILPDGTITVVK